MHIKENQDVNETGVIVTIEDSKNSSNNIQMFDGSFPIELDLFRSICHILLVITGVPLNLIIVSVILAFRRLHNKPRNVLWLGVTFCNLLTLLTILVEFIAHETKNNIVCLVFISTTGVAYTWLLFDLLLALADRYAAIVHPLWHRKKITVQRAIVGQTVGFCSIVFILKFPFITKSVPLYCGICPVHGKVIAVTNMSLLILCIIAQILVYHKTRQYFNNQQSDDTSISFVPTLQKRRETAVLEFSNDLRHHPGGSGTSCSSSDRPQNDRIAGSSLMIRHLKGGNRRMEVEATWSLLSGVFSLLLFTFPTLMFGFIDWGCRLVYGEGQCTRIDSMTLYSRELLLGHLVYNPVMYMIRSHEFSSTVREKFSIKRHQVEQ